VKAYEFGREGERGWVKEGIGGQEKKGEDGVGWRGREEGEVDARCGYWRSEGRGERGRGKGRGDKGEGGGRCVRV